MPQLAHALIAVATIAGIVTLTALGHDAPGAISAIVAIGAGTSGATYATQRRESGP